MKRGKGIRLFLVFVAVSFVLGMFSGFQMHAHFYPREQAEYVLPENEQIVVQETEGVTMDNETAIEVDSKEDTLTADTVYIVLEHDLDTGAVVETSTRIPEKYISMNREQFEDNLKEYEENPPLTELERGFMSAQLLSFSAQRVEVQMDYQYIKPTSSFYIVVYDGHVKVMLEDKKTVYQDTEIELADLPEKIQQDVIQGLFIPNEESLYDFLENYTS